MKTGVYAGSFDPITNGHLDIITRASALFDKLYVAVLQNSAKTPCFSIKERIRYIQQSAQNFPNVEVAAFDGLLVDFAKNVNADCIVRGLRALTDFEYEAQLSAANKHLAGEIETIFLMTSLQNVFLSSSIVKEIGRYGGELKGLVPDAVCEDIKDKLKR